MLKVTIEFLLPDALMDVLKCVAYRNFAITNTTEIKNGKNVPQNDAFNGLICDLEVFTNKLLNDGFIWGRSGSHIWVSEAKSKKRILLIHN